MMRKVKYTLAFLAGVGYASAWWCVAVMDLDNGWIAVPAFIAFVSTLGIVAAIIHSLVKHWKDDLT